MRFKAKRKPDSLLRKVMRAFLFCLLPLIVFQTAIFSWSTSIVERELEQSVSSSTNNLAKKLEENSLSLSLQASYTCSSAAALEFLTYFKNYSTAQYYQKLGQILDTLKEIRTFNPLVQTIRFYFPSLEVCLISSNNSGISRVDVDTIRRKVQLGSSKSGIQPVDGEYIVSCSYPMIQGRNGKLPYAYVEIVISKERLSSILSDSATSQTYLTFDYDTLSDEFLFDRYPYLNAEDLDDLKHAISARDASADVLTDIRIAGERYKLYVIHSDALNMSFGQLLYVKDIESVPQRQRQVMVAYWILAVVLIGILFLRMERQIAAPTRDLVNALESTSSGNFDMHIPITNQVREYRLLSVHLNDMNDHIRELIRTNYEMTIAMQKAELTYLQAKTNPHFLYNSLQRLRFMIHYESTEQSDAFIDCLSRYFRFITDHDSNLTTLELEYNHAIDYLTIQSMRFEDKLKLEIDPLPEALTGYQVPCLILQPLLDNVLKHAKWDCDADRIIRLSIRTDQQIEIRVEDNGDPLPSERMEALRRCLSIDRDDESFHALTNINKRLHLLYGETYRLSIFPSALGGFGILLTLPGEKRRDGYDLSGIDR